MPHTPCPHNSINMVTWCHLWIVFCSTSTQPEPCHQDGFRCVKMGRKGCLAKNQGTDPTSLFNCQWAGSLRSLPRSEDITMQKTCESVSHRVFFYFCWCLAMFNPINDCPVLSRWVEATHYITKSGKGCNMLKTAEWEMWFIPGIHGQLTYCRILQACQGWFLHCRINLNTQKTGCWFTFLFFHILGIIIPTD